MPHSRTVVFPKQKKDFLAVGGLVGSAAAAAAAAAVVDGESESAIEGASAVSGAGRDGTGGVGLWAPMKIKEERDK